MALKIYKFRSIDELDLHLRGGLLAGSVTGAIPNLVGKTLVFAQPTAVTVTFVEGTRNDGSLLFSEIVTQLQAGVTNLVVSQKDGRLLLKSSSSAGVEVTGGTSRALLGFGNSTAKSRVYNAPGGSAPAFVQAYSADGLHVLVVQE